MLVSVVVIPALTRPQSEAGTVPLVSEIETQTLTPGEEDSLFPRASVFSVSLYAVSCVALGIHASFSWTL